MDTTEIRMTNLFEQLGLDSSPEAIATFIHDNHLPPEVNIVDAPCWSESQRQFLSEMLKANARWAIIIDQLNESLHEPH